MIRLIALGKLNCNETIKIQSIFFWMSTSYTQICNHFKSADKITNQAHREGAKCFLMYHLNKYILQSNLPNGTSIIAVGRFAATEKEQSFIIKHYK